MAVCAVMVSCEEKPGHIYIDAKNLTTIKNVFPIISTKLMVECTICIHEFETVSSNEVNLIPDFKVCYLNCVCEFCDKFDVSQPIFVQVCTSIIYAYCKTYQYNTSIGSFIYPPPTPLIPPTTPPLLNQKQCVLTLQSELTSYNTPSVINTYCYNNFICVFCDVHEWYNQHWIVNPCGGTVSAHCNGKVLLLAPPPVIWEECVDCDHNPTGKYMLVGTCPPPEFICKTDHGISSENRRSIGPISHKKPQNSFDYCARPIDKMKDTLLCVIVEITTPPADLVCSRNNVSIPISACNLSYVSGSNGPVQICITNHDGSLSDLSNIDGHICDEIYFDIPVATGLSSSYIAMSFIGLIVLVGGFVIVGGIILLKKYSFSPSYSLINTV